MKFSHREEERAGRLLDVEGGWDVGIGNVVLSADGVPVCGTAGFSTF